MRIFHHNDMDGYAAAAVVVSLYKDSRSMISHCVPINYSDETLAKFAKVPPREEVCIVDYSFTKSTCHILDTLISKKCKIVWIDHHDSSIELCESNPKYSYIPGIRSKTASGAALTYMYANHCSFEKCPEFIKLISDYDTFSRKMLPVSDYFKLGYDANFNGYVPTFLLLLDLLMESKLPKMVEEKNEKYNEFKMKKLIDEGKVIKSYVDSENYSYCRTFSYEALIDGYVGLVINKRSNSWVFGDLYNKYKIVCTWVFDGKLYHYSLFSADESVDCAKIAELYGGGGHKGAAGFISNELIYKKKDTI